ncbi:MAG: hypothetical protein KKD11_04015, partial [Candidatus Omnitrophica bacterium]|nr:hypothetical protein [Candidatus Omnitrophota bacterium]
LTRKGDTINYTYDDLNRLEQKSGVGIETTDYDYDIASRLTDISSAPSSISYTYDDLNRVIQATQTLPYTLYYEYDDAGSRTKLTYPDNTYITYEYDELNRITYIRNQAYSIIASYTYDILSRRATLDYAKAK